MREDPKLAMCTKCRKLFVPLLDDHKCPECKAEQEEKIYLVEHAIYFGMKTTMEDICEYTQLSHEEVAKILKNLRYLNESVQGEIHCARCKSEIAQTGSEFCLDCRLFLHRSMQKARRGLSAKLQQQPYASHTLTPLNNVLAAMDKKRTITSASTLRPKTPKFK